MAILGSSSHSTPGSLDGHSSGSSPIIHRRRISDKDLESLVRHHIRDTSYFTLFMHIDSSIHHDAHNKRYSSSRQRYEDDENLRKLRSRSEFSGKSFAICSSNPEVTVLSTGKPISEFVPYYVWHEKSDIHFYNLTTGRTTSGTNVTVALNNFVHPHSLARVHNDPKTLIRQVDQAFGVAHVKGEDRFLEINPSLLHSFQLQQGYRENVKVGGIEYFEELILPLTLQRIVSVDIFKASSPSYRCVDRDPPIPESRYLATINYQGGVRTDSLTGKVIGTECTVLEVLSVKKDQNYTTQRQAQMKILVGQWIFGAIAAVGLTTVGVLAYLSSDSGAIFHTQNILDKGRSLADPSYYRDQAEREATDAPPERQSLIATVIADDLVLQENDALARSYYSRAVSLDPHNLYAQYGVLITDVIAGISCKKTGRQEKASYFFVTKDQLVPCYTCAWGDANVRVSQYALADHLLTNFRAAGGDESLEKHIIAARTLSASSDPIIDKIEAFVYRPVLYSRREQIVRRVFDGGGVP